MNQRNRARLWVAGWVLDCAIWIMPSETRRSVIQLFKVVEQAMEQAEIMGIEQKVHTTIRAWREK